MMIAFRDQKGQAGEASCSHHHADFSLDAWMGLTPPELLQAHLRLDRQGVPADKDADRSGRI
jgi:hypothetical protein